MVLLVTCLGTAATLFFALNRVPTYTATAELLVQSQTNQVVDVEAVVAGLTGDETSVQTQIRLLQSPNHAYNVMESLDLFGDPEFMLPKTGEAGNDPGGTTVFKQVASWFGDPSSWVSGDAEAVASQNDELLPPSVSPNEATALLLFNKKLNVSQAGTSRIINVTFTSTDPGKAALVAGRIVELFVENNKKQKVTTTGSASDWLAQRVDSLRSELQAQEQEIEEYRTANGLFTRQGGADLEANELVGFNSQLLNVRTEVTSLETTLSLIASKREQEEELFSIPEIAVSPTLLDLQTQQRSIQARRSELSDSLGVRHPRMVALGSELIEIVNRIDQEVDRIVQTITNRVRLLKGRGTSLEAEIARIRGNQRNQNVVSIGLRDLEREADSVRRLYESFLLRLKETREQAGLVQPDVTVVSKPAKPTSPSSAGPKLFLVIGFCSSFMVGSLLAILLDGRDKTVRDGIQARKLLGVDAVTLVPRIGRLKAKGYHPYQYLIEKPMSAYAEAVRNLLVDLRRADRDGAQVVLASSSLPDEGKTSLVVSLAFLAAKLGKRVLIIDFDRRNPSVGQQFNITPSTGIVECIRGEATLEEAIYEEVETNLDVLLVSQKDRDPASMYEVDHLGRILAAVDDAYDLIFIDCPPILGLIETQIVAELADDALFIVQWGETDEMTAQEGFRQLAKSGVNIVGVALNRVDMNYQAKHGEGHAERHYKKFEKYYIN